MFSQTAEYAFRAMTCLASRTGAPSTTDVIAQQARIPPGYLAKVMRDLVVAQLVTSQRGPNGGFLLARPAERISVLDIVSAVDPVHRIRTCPASNPPHPGLCSLHARLDEAMALIESALRATTLAQVVAEHRGDGACERLRSGRAPAAYGTSDAA